MKILRLFLGGALALAGLLLLAGQLGFLAGKPPPDLGVRDGRLKPPSATPNSVSSQAGIHADHPQRLQASIAPLPYTGDARAAMGRLAALLETTPGCVLVQRVPAYLYAQCQTRWLKFTDDVEFALDEAGSMIHVRSASRLGRKDFGVNRARVETLRAQFVPSAQS